MYGPRPHTTRGVIMATSSIGQPVVLTEERAKRLMGILSRPHKPATAPGEPLKLSKRKLDPKKLK